MKSASVALLLFPFTLAAQFILPEDRGLAGADQAGRRLGTTTRVLYITAHPDDEDGGAITELTRGRGADVTLLSLTRGESGANLITGDFFDSLGALRTLELLRAAQYYGCRVRFTNHIDYGYSKTVDEAWRSWNRDKLLGQVVRVVRDERPHIIIGRWQGTARDGHGHHSAAGIMAQLAYEAAADASRYPEAGPAWQASKLYAGNWRENEDWTVRVNSGSYDVLLGRSYAQNARDGLRWQRSQGAGAVASRPGPQTTYYKLLASRLAAAKLPAREETFLDGLDEPTNRSGAGAAMLAGKQLAAARESGADPRRIARLQDALNTGWAIELEALVQPAQPITGMMAQFRPYETFAVATPGQTFEVALTFHSHLRDLRPTRYELLGPAGWSIAENSPGRFTVTVPENAAPSAAFWMRDSVRELTYTLSDPSRFGQPLPAPPLLARAHYRYEDVESFVEATPLVSRIDTLGGQQLRPLAVGPALSVHFATEAGVLPLGRSRYALRAIVRNVASRAIAATVRVELPAGWRSEPAQARVQFQKEGEEAAVAFTAIAPPTATATAAINVTAVARAEGKEYRQRFHPHTYAGLDTLYLLRPARHTIRRVDVKTAPRLRIGYVAGTGDDVPQTLAQLGVPYDLLTSAALATGNLSQYSAILLGIRAYAAREDVKTYNQRLLDYVARGGVVIVQYNTPEYDAGYGPFPYSMGRNPEEVSEENAPVTVLDPADPVFRAPNRITPADFDGWIEQRGSKFFTTWDPRWKPLIETHDTGQAPQKGAWLVARHGQGLYVYCALAWYRQLPFAVPGAVRLFANLISLRPLAAAPARRTARRRR